MTQHDPATRPLCHVCDNPATVSVVWTCGHAFEASDLCDQHTLERIAALLPLKPIDCIEIRRELQASFADRMDERLNGRDLIP